jgi:hypothetical protein
MSIPRALPWACHHWPFRPKDGPDEKTSLSFLRRWPASFIPRALPLFYPISPEGGILAPK